MKFLEFRVDMKLRTF